MLLAVGYALATSVPALGVAAALVVLWVLKAAVEERWLEERFAGYSEYRRRTPRRFLPWLL
jgi:protein-S-isoprenylcysteine O-methyltransferase Ste14